MGCGLFGGFFWGQLCGLFSPHHRLSFHLSTSADGGVRCPALSDTLTRSSAAPPNTHPSMFSQEASSASRPFRPGKMLFSPRFSLSSIHVKLTAKGLLRNLQLLSGCGKSTVVFRTVDRGQANGSARGQVNAGQPDLVPPETKPRGVEYYKTLCERKNQTIQQLKSNVHTSSRRFEAIAVVVQNLHAEHEDAVKRRRELSLELLHLHENLVSSVQACQHLEQEKEELRAAFDGVLQKVQEQHRSDLLDLEERLQTFYTAEWEKVHQTYQEEADRCKSQMERQLEDLKANHEVLKKDLETSHEEKVESLKKHYEQSLEEVKISQEQKIQALEKTLEDAETTLSNQIEELTTENTVLNGRLKVEEEQRKQIAEKYQKDSHTLYLEQELESLKVVLDIKNKQIHQQDKKLMQMDKLMEKNVKLDECLKKVQQENEDLKARMDKHAALSRQLSSEQAALQESLQKETKVNKRLSMENEELLWKLQNGDLSSPRKISPSSPSGSLRSPRNSGVFSSVPVSPR